MDGSDSKYKSPSARQLYGEQKLPHKFCPFCGHRNEGTAERCEECGKDISWLVVPEQGVYPETPRDKPRTLPKSREPFSRRAILIVVGVLLIIAIAIAIAVVMVSRSSGAVIACSFAVAGTMALDSLPTRATGDYRSERGLRRPRCGP